MQNIHPAPQGLIKPGRWQRGSMSTTHHVHETVISAATHGSWDCHECGIKSCRTQPVCLICMPYMHALYTCLICMHALYACLVGMPYMHTLCVCLACRWQRRYSAMSPGRKQARYAFPSPLPKLNPEAQPPTLNPSQNLSLSTGACAPK